MSQKTYQYLDSLPLSEEEKIKITNQGYNSAACLYSIIKAAGASVVLQWLGRASVDDLLAALEKQLTPEELVELNKPVPQYPLGLIVELPEPPVPSWHPTSAGEADFQEKVLCASLPVVVDFWAQWCPPCRALAPLIDKFACEYAGALAVVKVDYEQNQGLAQRYGIDSIPCLLFFHQGKLVNSQVGLPEYPELKQLFEQFAAETAGIQAGEKSTAEQAFAQAVAQAQAAENEAVNPAITALHTALLPINDCYQNSLEAAAADLQAGTITQEEHDRRCEEASRLRQSELSPHMRSYVAVRTPALDQFITAMEVAVRQFAAASAAGK